MGFVLVCLVYLVRSRFPLRGQTDLRKIVKKFLKIGVAETDRDELGLQFETRLQSKAENKIGFGLQSK
jgi:hypothetical protein